MIYLLIRNKCYNIIDETPTAYVCECVDKDFDCFTRYFAKWSDNFKRNIECGMNGNSAIIKQRLSKEGYITEDMIKKD